MIRIEVQGNDIYQNGKNCGVCGEGNSTEMLIAFSEEWKEYAKKVVFYDARGENPVTVLLTGTNKEPGEEIYHIKIPAEPLKFEGDIEYVIDGSIEGARKKSVGGKLRVRYAPDSTSEDVPEEVSQSVAEQLQAEAVRISDMAVNAVPYIGDNGNWFKYDPEQKLYVDTGIYATGPEGPQGVQGIQGVQGEKGDTGATGAKGDKGDKGDKGNKGDPGQDGKDGADGKDGYTPMRGVDYWRAEDKEEIQREIKLPILKNVYTPSLATMWLDGGGHYTNPPDKAGNYEHLAACNNEVGFIFTTYEEIGELLGENADYSITINRADYAPAESAESSSLQKTTRIGLAFVEFEDEYDDEIVTRFMPIYEELVDEMKSYKYSVTLPEEIPEGYENGKLAVYVMFNFTDWIDGDFSVSNPVINVLDEKSGVWFVWDAGLGRYINSGVSAIGPQGKQGENGYNPQRGVDYWTDEDKAEMKGYVDEAILGGVW